MYNNKKILKEYFINVKRANSESAKKELFKDLLVRIFDKDKKLHEIINQISLGAEKTILNIPYEDRTKRGRADTLYGKVIIEFEKNLKATEEHAKEQLSEYLVGDWKVGEEYNYTLIATDCIGWVVYAPDPEIFIYGKGKIKPTDIELIPKEWLLLDESNLESFPYFIDRYLFKNERRKATLEDITFEFGETSNVFINSFGLMRKNFKGFKKNPTLSVSYDEWNKFLSIAYGRFNATEEVFLVHTYLSIFSKILAYVILTHDEFIDQRELKGIMKGDIFNKLNVENFIEDDFYHWVNDEDNFKALIPVFRIIVRKIQEFDFVNVRQDILKGVYQELIDLETRHALGEYYTPDWLCELIVKELKFKKQSKILDPACGSGSFLVASILKLRKKYPDISIDELSNNLMGIDIHPLSVQISKTSLLLSLNDLIKKSRRPVFLNVFLANSLYTPSESLELFGQNSLMLIDKKQFEVNSVIFENPNDFDLATTVCEDLAEYSSKKEKISRTTFGNNLKKKGLTEKISDELIESYYKIYEALKYVKENERDSIWKFIIQNLYKPFFINQQFDFVIGNPPWLTYSDISNESYQDLLYRLAKEYDLIPESKANMPHLEIASIFLSHSASYFLKDNGSIAFVMPRSVISTDQHDNIRTGRALGYKLNCIWDLFNVSTLFRIPSCVLFANKHSIKSKEARKLPSKGIKGLVVSGKFKFQNASFNEIRDKISFKEVKWYYSRLRNRTAFTNKKLKETNATNYYYEYFKQGATIVPRSFYFVDAEQDIGKDYKNKIIQFKTSGIILKDAKPPWKKFTFSGRANTNYLFLTCLSKNILPFLLINPPLVLLPIKIMKKSEDKSLSIKLIKADDILKSGDNRTANWFKKAEEAWEKNKTEKSKNMSLYKRLNFQRGIIEQDLNKRYLVLYTASSKDANAVVLDRTKYKLDFIVESKAYWFATDDFNEAYYVCCFLNCNYTNEIIKDFQSRGLFGARDVHKKILEIPLPQFNKKNIHHRNLASLGIDCSNKIIKSFKNLLKEDLKPHELGRLRLQIRKDLQSEIKNIDKIIKEII